MLRLPNIILATISLYVLMFAGIAAAADEMFEQVRINYTRKRPEKESRKELRELNRAWFKGCKILGGALSGKDSPWVYGVFEKYGCTLNGRASKKGDSRGAFRVDILDTKAGIKITVQQAGRSRKKFLTLGVFSFSATDNFPFYLSDPEFVDILALSISEYLPAAGVLKNGTAPEGKSSLSLTPIELSDIGSAKYSHPAPPGRLTFYNLKFDKRERLWRSQVLGESELEGGAYLIPEGVAEAVKSGRVYVHRSEGPYDADVRFRASFKEAEKKLEEAIERDGLQAFLAGKAQNLLDALLGSAAAGYVGLRYGPQVLPSDSELGKLIGKTALISLLVEIRAGPVKGLRYYYDTVPEQKASVIMADGSENNQYLGFSRHVIGYSFGLELGTFIDRITVDPKLGVWRFDARLPAAADENGGITAIENFNLGRTASLALEAGLESDADWYVLRGWAGMDTGFSVLKTGGVVSSYRFGIDAFLSLGPDIPFFFNTELKTTWILFYVFDRMSIKLREDPELAVGENAITGVAYDAAYAGAGVALSW